MHYIYVYLNPLKSGSFCYDKHHFDYEPFYIGKGKDTRYLNHLVEKISCNAHKFYTINKIYEHDLQPIIIKLYDNITQYTAFRLERLLIKIIGRRDLNKGPLTNLTDGGEGTSGYKMTDEQRQKIKKALTNKPKTKEHNLKVSNALKGKPLSDETKKKISVGKLKNPTRYWKDKKLSEETKNKISNTLTGIKQSEETKNKRANSLRLFTIEQKKSIFKEYLYLFKNYIGKKKGKKQIITDIICKKYICSRSVIQKLRYEFKNTNTYDLTLCPTCNSVDYTNGVCICCGEITKLVSN
jgi:hypothetical protein